MSRSYTAFISYSHRDSQWARWVQRSLENYRVPKTLASELAISRKLGKVFRDREELSTGQNLGDHLTAALDNSDNLIVICSPNSKASPWVAKEIEYFKALGRGDRIFCLLVEGGAESLADPLLTDVDGNPLEPLAADPRTEGDGKHLAKLKLISGILDTNLDQLAQRERARRQRLFAGYAGLANAFFIAVGAALYFEQERQNEAAQKALERELGMQNIASMTDFVTRTRQYYDKQALGYVSEKFSTYLDRFEDGDLTAPQKLTKANALRVVGESQYELGEVELSINAMMRSRSLLYKASAQSPDDIDLAIERAFSDFYVGAIYLYERELSAAREPIEDYSETILTLYNKHPSHPLLLEESINAPTAVLSLLTDMSTSTTEDLRQAVDVVSEAVAEAVASSPDDATLLHAADSAMHYAAHAHMKSCEVFNALPYRERAVEYARKAVELDPRNRDYKTNLANALFAYAQMHLLQSASSKAVQSYVEALEIQTELLSEDPENEYLKSRRRQTLTELLATTTFHPDIASEMQSRDYEATISLDKSIGLSPTLDMYLVVRGVATKDSQLVQQALASLGRVFADGTPESDRIQLVGTLKRLSERALGTTFVADLPPAQINDGESCNSRLIRWAKYELEGNYAQADATLHDAKGLGLSGMALGFYSDSLRGLRK